MTDFVFPEPLIVKMRSVLAATLEVSGTAAHRLYTGGGLHVTPDRPIGNLQLWHQATVTISSPGSHFAGEGEHVCPSAVARGRRDVIGGGERS